MPHSLRNVQVALAVNSGPPSVAYSSGMPNVANSRHRESIKPLDPSCTLSMTVGVSVNRDEVVHSFVGEEVRTDALKGVGRWDWWVEGCAWL